MPKLKRERWTVTLIGEPGDQAPLEVRIRHFLKHAWRRYRLKNCGATATDGRWVIALEAAGNDSQATVSMKVGQLLDGGTTCFGLRVVDLRGVGVDGQALGLAGQREALLGPVLMDEGE